MKKILFISETIVLPVERGNRKRAFNLVEMMRSEGCEVDYLYLQTYSDEDYTATRDWIGADHFYILPNRKRSFGVFLKRKVRKVLEILHCQVAFKYFTIDEKCSPKLPSDMRDFLKDRHYDIVWVEYIYNSCVLPAIPEGTLKVLDTINAFTFKRQVYEAVGYRNYEFALRKEEEARGINRADYAVAIQEEEADFFRSIADPRVRIVTIGENMTAKENHLSNNKDILFLGSYYVVNREGILDFIKNILPLIYRKCPEARLKIAGTICKHLPDSPDYDKLGIVDDVDITYQSARAVINPVHYGTGINIKTIEALSKGCPLISHTTGVRGLRADYPIALVSDDNEGFADAVVKVLTDDQTAQELIDNALRFTAAYREKNLSALREILS